MNSHSTLQQILFRQFIFNDCGKYYEYNFVYLNFSFPITSKEKFTSMNEISLIVYILCNDKSRW